MGRCPVIAYGNNRERQGDFEQITSLIDAYNGLMSSRLTDKKKFVDALLVFFGMTLRDGDEEKLAREKFLDGAPLDARAEYIQKTFDEQMRAGAGRCAGAGDAQDDADGGHERREVRGQ